MLSTAPDAAPCRHCGRLVVRRRLPNVNRRPAYLRWFPADPSAPVDCPARPAHYCQPA